MIETLQREFGIPDRCAVTAGNNGLPKMTMCHASGATVEIYLHGAHITSWKTPGGDELFFLSRESWFDPQRPIRGGIPVIFPQFCDGALPQHGLARIHEWKLQRVTQVESGDMLAELVMTESPETLALWPYPFRVTLTVRLAERALTVAMQVTNTGEQAFPFHAVLHTYFGVEDIRRTAVRGLRGTTVIDPLHDNLRTAETREEIRFAEETDLIYVNAPDTVQIDDEGHRRCIDIVKKQMPDVVVWNPWIAKAQRMPDFGHGEYQRMVCVETGNMAEQRQLAPSATWRGETEFSYR